MEKSNQIRIDKMIYLFSIIFVLFFCVKISFTQDFSPSIQLNLLMQNEVKKIILSKPDKIDNQSTQNYSFIAIFKDTLLEPVIEPTEEKEKGIALSIAENEIRWMIAEDSVISLNTVKDSIWTFDTIIEGRRCYGSVFSGPAISKVIKNDISKNVIFLYGSADMSIRRLLNGLFIYHSKDVNWEFQMKTED